MDLSNRMRAARKHAQLSQEALARQVGVTRAAVANWEITTRPNPCATHLESVAKLTEVSFEWLATGRGEMLLRAPERTVLPFGEMTRNAAERRLLLNFRKLSLESRSAVLYLVDPAAETTER